MLLPSLVLLPAAAGIAALLLRGERARRVLLLAAAGGHSALVALCWAFPPAPAWRGMLALDPLGLLFLSVTSLLFLAVAPYTFGYLARETRGDRPDFAEGQIFSNAPEAVFIGCLLLFLASMTLVTTTPHFGLMWVAIEATSLASAPLIYFHRHRRSLEAAWKYLLICSVGIALALLGYMLLAVAAVSEDGSLVELALGPLTALGPALAVPWLKAAFLFFLVGYGTKMGLAPFHFWLPDAHSESPSVVSALLSGALLNCAFLGILRAYQVMGAAGQGPFARELLVLFGLVSMAVAAFFIIGQGDYKRMLAYSSVEHMGILALGVGLGGVAAWGAMLHALNHSLAKGLLFLAASNILAAYKTKSTEVVRGVTRVLPVTGLLWIVGLLAITGCPPFGPFLSELAVLKGALAAGRYGVAAAYLLLLAIVFTAMAHIVLRMAQGRPLMAEIHPRRAEPLLATLPLLALAGLLLLLGLTLPAPLRELLSAAAASVGGSL